MKPALPQEPVCDFCKSKDVVTCFLTTARTTMLMDPDTGKSITLNSDPHWVACEGCAFLVRAGDRGGLAKRSYDFGPKIEAGVTVTKLGIIATQASMFWPGFKGKEHPISDHDTEDTGGPGRPTS